MTDGLAAATGARPAVRGLRPAGTRQRRDGCRTPLRQQPEQPSYNHNEGDTPVNRILSSAVKVAGSLAVVGGALAAAATPAGALNPIRAYGLAAQGFINIPQVAVATNNFTPATASSFVFPGFVTTGGILDRATATSAFANVGSPKIYIDGHITDQLNASNAMSSCRLLFGVPFGSVHHPERLDHGVGAAQHRAADQPRPQHEDFPPGGDRHAQQAGAHGRRPHRDRDLRLRLWPEPVHRRQPLLNTARP